MGFFPIMNEESGVKSPDSKMNKVKETNLFHTIEYEFDTIVSKIRNIDNNISVRCGCFDGNITEFKDKVIKTHNDNKHAKAYLAAIELAKIQIELD